MRDELPTVIARYFHQSRNYSVLWHKARNQRHALAYYCCHGPCSRFTEQ
jgi:hypothetical protein